MNTQERKEITKEDNGCVCLYAGSQQMVLKIAAMGSETKQFTCYFIHHFTALSPQIRGKQIAPQRGENMWRESITAQCVFCLVSEEKNSMH